MAKNTRKAPDTASTAAPAPASTDTGVAEFNERARERRLEAAQDETARAEEEGRLPANTAVTSPAPGTTMNPSSGAFVEPEVISGVPADHPSVENNPRFGTSAVQNGQDFNDPNRRDPRDPKFAGQGLDLSVYGDGEPPK
jgi:hypothetical protein